MIKYFIIITLTFIANSFYCQTVNSNFLIGIWENTRGPLYSNAQTELTNYKNNNVLIWTNPDSTETICSYSFDSLTRTLVIGIPEKMETTIDTVFYDVKIISQSEIELYPKRIIFYNHTANKWIDQNIDFGVFDHFKRRKKNQTEIIRKYEN